MFDKFKIKSKGKNLSPAAAAVSPGKEPSKKQVYQSRYQYGTNIGACFVLEKWIYHSIFPDGTNTELEVAEKLLKDKGEEEARKIFENHWSSFLNDDDWNYLKTHGVTSLRVPFGYWNVDGGKFTKGTRFEKVGQKIYKNSWSIYKSHFIEKAQQYDISILVDLHGLPFGANGSDHSGEQGNGKADFWSNEQAQLLIVEALRFIAKDLKNYDNIAGIQIVNEADSNLAKEQGRYYSAAINEIREEDKDVPIVISDSWQPDQWVSWIQSKEKDDVQFGVVIDSHCYRCFSDSDKQKSPKQIINDLNGDLLTNLPNNGDGVDVTLGEYSCVLDGQSWDKDDANSHRDELVIEFGKKQVELFAERAKFGSYFWTYKFESGNGGEWDFKTMTDKGAIKSPYAGQGIPDSFEDTLKKEFDAHTDYWNKQNSNEKYEHDRYKEGFTTAWKDATSFARSNGSALGRVGAWKASRFQEHIKAKGSSKHLWEWQQGFDAGLKNFYKK